jgi:N-formylglutamate amidohydrolase
MLIQGNNFDSGGTNVIVEDFGDNLPSFTLSAPAEQRVPFVFNSPHSGRTYPPSFLAAAKLDKNQIRGSEDFHVDGLFQDVVPLGAPLMQAHFPRAFVDINREPYELDQKLFSEKLPSYSNGNSVRVTSGLGTIARVVAESREIYRQKPTLDEAMRRIETHYRPYHDALRRLLARTHVHFGYSVLVDCHSMPSSAVDRSRGKKPDIIIGDRYGTSCPSELSEAIVEIFHDLGMSVARNKPYAGGFITEHYGRPLRGLHAVQIEINRGLYMDEKKLELTPGFDHMRQIIKTFAERIVAIPDGTFYPEQQAAE